MSTTLRIHWIIALLLALLLAGCPKPAQPTPTPSPVPPPTLPPPTAVSGTPTPAGWLEQQTDALTIWLPVDWQVVDFSSGDLQTVFADLEQRDPELARIIGSAEALRDAAFWAFRQLGADALFADNLNIRRAPLNGQHVTRMQEVVDPVVAQYEQLGFQVLAVNANLVIGDQPAAHIAFSFDLASAGDQPTSVQGHQYLVATDTDLWILSYSASPDSVAELAPVFEQSARSFRVK